MTTLAQVADVLVPGAGVLGATLDEHPLAAAVAGTVAALGPDLPTALVALETADPDAFTALLRVCAEAWYADPRSWPSIGYEEGVRPGDIAGVPEFPPPPPLSLGDLDDRYDVIVVGAGAGGGIAAMVLAEAGARVLVVERGRWLTPSQVGRDHLRNHRFAAYGHNTGPDLEGNPRVLELDGGRQLTFAPHQPGWHNNAMTVGGGTRVYGGMAWRFVPEDFRLASIYGVPEGSSLADWPLSYDDLEPFYTQAEWEIGVSGATGHRFMGHRSKGYPMPPMPTNPEAEILGAAARRLGWATAPIPLLINTVARDGRPACAHRGACVGFACPVEAKNGTQNTALPRALATHHCQVITETVAARITIEGPDDHRRATAVELVKDGQRRTIPAGHVVVAAGAIETARLLLLSGIENDHLGRHQQGHAYTGAFGYFADEVIDVHGPGPSIATTQFLHHNPGVIGGGTLCNEFTKLPAIFWSTMRRQGAPRWGQAMVDDMDHSYLRTMHVLGPAQEIPSPEARVRLHPQVRDANGLPVAHLSGRAHPEDLKSTELLRSRAEQWLREAGAEEVWSHPHRLFLSGGQHQAGTCRMSADPTGGVTDKWGKVWHHTNLHVMDGSLHVTNGGCNPVLTIMALAFRNAAHLAERL